MEEEQEIAEQWKDVAAPLGAPQGRNTPYEHEPLPCATLLPVRVSKLLSDIVELIPGQRKEGRIDSF